jgi:hypothetical protein
VIYQFQVGRLSCAVVSDGQMEPPLAPPLEAFFTPGTGVPERDVREACRHRLLGRAADENLLVHAYHMPFPRTGRVERHRSTFGWRPVA